MGNESLTGEPLVAKLRALTLTAARSTYSNAAFTAQFTDAEQDELARWAHDGQPVDEGVRDLLFEKARHLMAIELLHEFKVASLADLPPEAFSS